MIIPAVFVLASFFFAWLGAALLRHWAPRLGLFDIPNERSSHAVPTPRGGGLAIVIVVLIALPVFALASGAFSARIVMTYLIAGAIIAAVGWVDDRRSLSAGLRLMLQIAVAVITIIGMGIVADVRLPFAGVVHWGWLGLPIMLLWIVGLTNAYNFMDGIDGLAAGQAVIGGVFWAVIGWQSGAELIAWLGVLIASASFGFLLHNWSPARIFMGDVASGFLGFSFAVLPLMAKIGEAQESLLGTGALVLGVFVFDAGITFLRRLWRRENVLLPHRSHLYQRLTAQGCPHPKVTALYLALGAVMGVLGLIYRHGPESAASLSAVAAAAILIALLIGVILVEQK